MLLKQKYSYLCKTYKIHEILNPPKYVKKRSFSKLKYFFQFCSPQHPTFRHTLCMHRYFLKPQRLYAVKVHQHPSSSQWLNIVVWKVRALVRGVFWKSRICCYLYWFSTAFPKSAIKTAIQLSLENIQNPWTHASTRIWKKPFIVEIRADYWFLLPTTHTL